MLTTTSPTSATPPATIETTALDRVRVLAVLATATTQVLLPLAGTRLGLRPNGEVSSRHPTPITPPDGAFTIWLPIFASCTASAIIAALPGHAGREVHRRTGWYLAGAYAATTAWSYLEQSERFTATAFVLPLVVAAAGAAHARLQTTTPTGTDRLVAISTGLLTGWTALAAAVNVAAVLASRGADLSTPRATTALAGAVLSVAASVSAAVGRSRRGGMPLAAATSWGLATLAATTRSNAIRASAATSAAALIATAITRHQAPTS